MPLQKRIFFQICPTETLDFENIKLDRKNNIIYVRQPQDFNREGREDETKKVVHWVFPNDGIFKNISQESVYHAVRGGVLEDVINGHNALIVVFGQTGSGKTFTTTGLHLTEKDFGILPRITEDLLKMIGKQPENIKIFLYMSYVEFYKDYAIDLLEEYPDKMDIRKCKQPRKIPITTMLDALKYIFIAEARKSCIKRKQNYYSNLTSTVATFQIIRQNMNRKNLRKTCSKLHIVDLVGTDSAENDKNSKEIELFHFLLSNDQEEKAKLRKRMTALIHYLADDVSNETILRFLGNIKGRKEDHSVMLSMLRFGNVFQGIEPKKQVMEFYMPQKVTEACLQKEIIAIEKEKRLGPVFGEKNIDYETDLEGIKHLNDLVDQYLERTIEEMPLMSFSNLKAVLKRLKDLHRDYKKVLKIIKEVKKAKKKPDTKLKKIVLPKKILKLISKINTPRNTPIHTPVHTPEKQKRHLSIVSGRSRSIRLSINNALKRNKIKKRPKKSHKGSNASSSSKKKSNASSADKVKKDEKVKKDQKVKKAEKVKKGEKVKKKSNTSSGEKVKKVAKDKKVKKGKKDKKVKKGHKNEKHVEVVHKASKKKSACIKSAVMPRGQEIWKMFSLSPFCIDAIKRYQLNEIDVKKGFHDYFKAERMRMVYAHERSSRNNEFDNQDNFLIKTLSKGCDESQKTISMLRERSLRAYAALRIYLKNRNVIARRIQYKYDKFSIRNSQALSPDVKAVENCLAEFTFGIKEVQAYLNLDCGEPVDVPEVADTTIMVNNLQRLMRYERAKRQKLLEKMKRERKH